MGLTRYEQETTISFNADESQATIYTSDPVWMRKLRKFRDENDSEFILVKQGKVDGVVISETYTFPKKLITIRSKTRVLSDEQKAAAAERMRKVNEKKEAQDERKESSDC